MIKVFIVDDSILIRNIVKKIIKENHNIEVIGEAANPVDAIKEFKITGLPDVFILDIEMPKMDGLSFLKKIQKEKPIPTIIFSSLTQQGSQKTIEALKLGACDVIRKPTDTKELNSPEQKEEFIDKIKAAAASKTIQNLNIMEKNIISTTKSTSDKLIAIGASTGGVQTIEAILTNLNSGHPPILITQHMPAGFTASFAKRLDKECKNSTVVEAKHDQVIQNNTVYIAPGDLHLEVAKKENSYFTILKNYPKVSNHKPSVDVLFSSFSKEVKEKTLAFLLTGMGKDGALGLKKIKDVNGETYTQNKESSIVYGMPKAAFEMGASTEELSIEQIVQKINNLK